jgi:HAMP domain-containing protein
MRRRLAAAFVLLAFVVLALFAAIRLGTLHDLIRDREANHLQHEAAVMARALDAWPTAGQPVDEQAVRRLLASDEQATVVVEGGARLSATGGSFATDGDTVEVTGQARSGSTTVTLRQDPGVVRSVYLGTVGPVVAVSLLLFGLAGVLGYLLAARISTPFQRLAAAADALARGRSDLDLPTSRIPEVRAVAASLQAGASRWRRELERDQEFLKDASHRLRTPMTGMRLELEELQQRDDLDQGVRTTVDRSIQSLDQLQELTTGIFAVARAARGTHDQVRVTMRQLAQQAANGWASTLSERDVQVSVTVDGDPDQTLTPGPVEQVLDLLLADLRQSAQDTVVLTLAVAPEQVTIQARAEARTAGPRARVTGPDQVRQMVEVLGGRCTGDPVDGGIRVWLPRR